MAGERSEKVNVSLMGKWRSFMDSIGADDEAKDIVCPSPPNLNDTREDYADRYRAWAFGLDKS